MAGRGEGVGVVVAEDAALTAQRLLLQFPGLRVVTQRRQVVGELAGGGEGVGVVLAEDAAAPGQGVLVQRAGPLVFTQPPQVKREVAGRGEGVGVIVTESCPPNIVAAFEHCQRGLRLAPDQQVHRGVIEESGGLGRNRVQGGIAVGRGQDVRQQPSPQRPPAQIGAHIAGRASGRAGGPPSPPTGRPSRHPMLGCGRAAALRGSGVAGGRAGTPWPCPAGAGSSCSAPPPAGQSRAAATARAARRGGR